ncbi:OmpA family protein [Streptomyces sp. HB132]|uniref:OmpA family protein n=1 Tax=Streptomyces sp. HB132 TaxID=767388 RepID=UPI0019602ABC|nr:OmpA family protein [Streptomyces sp. HB132]MBM7437337.1 outer membrane protein OmpA-like peptidoglycan-associated protein [Streptomyces sp. HB132]
MATVQPPTSVSRAPRGALRRRVGLCAVATVVVGTSTLWGTASATADDNPTAVPAASPPVEVDANSPGLMLGDGATLGDVRVLDIKSVVEDLGGEERREDTNVDITFALQAEVLFGKDSAKLSGAANARIVAIGEEIRNQSATKVRVFGFTDDLGSSAHGDVLSKKRADAVSGVLSPGLPNVTFEIRGYGEEYPIASNETEEGRKKNRRVEVTFQRTSGS